jgi:hypothetical protein
MAQRFAFTSSTVLMAIAGEVYAGGLDGRVMVWDMRVHHVNANGEAEVNPQVCVVVRM